MCSFHSIETETSSFSFFALFSFPQPNKFHCRLFVFSSFGISSPTVKCQMSCLMLSSTRSQTSKLHHARQLSSAHTCIREPFFPLASNSNQSPEPNTRKESTCQKLKYSTPAASSTLTTTTIIMTAMTMIMRLPSKSLHMPVLIVTFPTLLAS
jgi:hypothetical protein